MNRDLHNSINEQESVRPEVATAGVNGEECDLRGADSAEVVISIGAITGAAGDGAVTLEETDTTGTGYTAVAAADIIGSTPAALAANTSYRFGYKGSKRFVRAVLDIGGETNIAAAAVVVTSNLHRAPEDASYAS